MNINNNSIGYRPKPPT